MLCDGVLCTTTHLRRSMLSHPPAAWTPLDGANGLDFARFASIFVSLMIGHPNTITAVQTYFLHPQDPFNMRSSQPLYTLAPDVYASRLAQLLNTVWTAAMGMSAIAEGLDTTNATSDPDIEASVYGRALYANTTGMRYTTEQVLRCHYGWLVASLIATFVMLIAVVATPIIRLRRRGPEFTVSVANIIKDSQFVEVPATGSYLDSQKRTNLLRDVRIQFGDVEPDRDVGYLAVASVGGAREVARARKGRLYD